MSDFCDFVPDDPTCQKDDPKPDNQGGDDHGDMDKHGDHEDYEMEKEGSPLMGNLTYLQVALFSAIHAGAELFLYHEDDEYDAGEVLGTNTWKYLSELHHYSHFGIMSILAITQILSMVGVAGEINIMAWAYAEMIEMVLQLVMKIGNMYTYEMAYQKKEDSDSSSDDVTNAAAVMTGVKSGAVKSTIEEASNHFALHVEHENWMMAQVMALPEEAQEKYKSKMHHGDKHDDDHDDHEMHDDKLIAFIQKHTGYFTI